MRTPWHRYQSIQTHSTHWTCPLLLLRLISNNTGIVFSSQPHSNSYTDLMPIVLGFSIRIDFKSDVIHARAKHKTMHAKGKSNWKKLRIFPSLLCLFYVLLSCSTVVFLAFPLYLYGCCYDWTVCTTVSIQFIARVNGHNKSFKRIHIQYELDSVAKF